MDKKGISVARDLSLSVDREKKVHNMTMLIHGKNKNEVIIASDSWNCFKGESNEEKHYIKKICFNEKHPIIIGQAGENSMLFNNKIYYIKDYIQEACDMFDGYNIWEIWNILFKKTLWHINTVALDGQLERVIQYFVAYYDRESHSLYSFSFQFIKNEKEVLYNKHIFNNEVSFESFGTYRERFFHEKKKFLNSQMIPEKALKCIVFHNIYTWIKHEQDYDLDSKSVGGPIQYAVINDNGVLTHGIKPEKESILNKMKYRIYIKKFLNS